MKIRKGFVSNSSSTAFVIFSKEKLTHKLIKDRIRSFNSQDQYLLEDKQDALKNLPEAVTAIVSGRKSKDDILETVADAILEAHRRANNVSCPWTVLDCHYRLLKILSSKDSGRITEIDKECYEILKTKQEDRDRKKYRLLQEEKEEIARECAKAYVTEIKKEYPNTTHTELSDDNSITESYLEHSGIMYTLGDIVLSVSHR